MHSMCDHLHCSPRQGIPRYLVARTVLAVADASVASLGVVAAALAPDACPPGTGAGTGSTTAEVLVIIFASLHLVVAGVSFLATAGLWVWSAVTRDDTRLHRDQRLALSAHRWAGRCRRCRWCCTLTGSTDAVFDLVGTVLAGVFENVAAVGFTATDVLASLVLLRAVQAAEDRKALQALAAARASEQAAEQGTRRARALTQAAVVAAAPVPSASPPSSSPSPSPSPSALPAVSPTASPLARAVAAAAQVSARLPSFVAAQAGSLRRMRQQVGDMPAAVAEAVSRLRSRAAANQKYAAALLGSEALNAADAEQVALLREAAHYSSYATGAYGWPHYVMLHPLSCCCRLAAGAASMWCRARLQARQQQWGQQQQEGEQGRVLPRGSGMGRGGDPLRLHEVALELELRQEVKLQQQRRHRSRHAHSQQQLQQQQLPAVPRFNPADVLYSSFTNAFFSVPWFVAIDRACVAGPTATATVTGTSSGTSSGTTSSSSDRSIAAGHATAAAGVEIRTCSDALVVVMRGTLSADDLITDALAIPYCLCDDAAAGDIFTALAAAAAGAQRRAGRGRGRNRHRNTAGAAEQAQEEEEAAAAAAASPPRQRPRRGSLESTALHAAAAQAAFAVDRRKAFVHAGMWRAAAAVKAQLLSLGLLDRVAAAPSDLPLPVSGTQQAGQEGQVGVGVQRPRHGLQLVIAGHSLGAGVAALLSLQLRPYFSRLRCYAYAPPGALVSRDLSRAMEPFVTSVVVGNDFIPRLSLPALRVLLAQCLALAARCQVAKPTLLMPACCTVTSKLPLVPQGLQPLCRIGRWPLTCCCGGCACPCPGPLRRGILVGAALLSPTMGSIQRRAGRRQAAAAQVAVAGQAEAAREAAAASRAEQGLAMMLAPVGSAAAAATPLMRAVVALQRQQQSAARAAAVAGHTAVQVSPPQQESQLQQVAWARRRMTRACMQLSGDVAQWVRQDEPGAAGAATHAAAATNDTGAAGPRSRAASAEAAEDREAEDREAAEEQEQGHGSGSSPVTITTQASLASIASVPSELSDEWRGVRMVDHDNGTDDDDGGGDGDGQGEEEEASRTATPEALHGPSLYRNAPTTTATASAAAAAAAAESLAQQAFGWSPPSASPAATATTLVPTAAASAAASAADASAALQRLRVPPRAVFSRNMHVPGRILHLVKTGSMPTDAATYGCRAVARLVLRAQPESAPVAEVVGDRLAAVLCCCLRRRRRLYAPRWSRRSALARIRVAASVLHDHMPQTMRETLQAAVVEVEDAAAVSASAAADATSEAEVEVEVEMQAEAEGGSGSQASAAATAGAGAVAGT